MQAKMLTQAGYTDKSSTSSTRSTVAGVFNKAATECGSTSSGVARYYCSDVYGNGCSSNGKQSLNGSPKQNDIWSYIYIYI